MNVTEGPVKTATLEPPADAPGWLHPARAMRRWTYVSLGLGFVGLAILGAFLPILPTTPFLLLASWFFVRSSPRLQAWLRRWPAFGPALRDWEEQRTVPRRAKVAACVLVPVAITASAILGNLSWPAMVALIGLGMIGMVVVVRLRATPRGIR